ncbi:MAG TPA: sulfite exporter TauE/SafE family protein [Hyphomicrobium sp.]|jgi:uncharacterized membrane protein YfcA|nr:sulfite exporter TauE/SafE family protein [Hyphomicrobium sp.]
MNIYLPIAEMSVNVAVFLGMGCAVGFLSGMFGVGGGFLLTPLLIFMGVPSAVAVGTGSMQILASSVAGGIAQYRRKNVDIKMGLVLVGGGVVGAVIGVALVRILRQIGQFDLFVSLSYVLFLGAVGGLMLIESIGTIRRARSGQPLPARKTGQHSWVHGLPFKMRFNRSKLYISAVPAALIGAFVGFMAALMGVGGGFVMVPAMIYLLRVPTSIVIGTSLFQIVFVMAATTLLQAMQNKTVDVVLALLLIVGGVVGAQLGVIAGARLKGEQLRFLLAALVLLVCLRIGWELIARPEEIYSIGPLLGVS